MIVFDRVISKQPKVKDASCERLVADVKENGLKVNSLNSGNEQWEVFLFILYSPLPFSKVLDLSLNPLAIQLLNSFENAVMT